jgi:predicted RNA-binding protein with PIN domain
MHWVVDAMNVVGSRPDGWWKDRRGALQRLVEQLEAWASATDEHVTAVLEQPPSPPLASSAVEVVWAPSPAPNSADAEIVRCLPEWLAGSDEVTVVTSDRDLADRARSLGATVEGAATFRRRLDDPSISGR